MSIRHLPVYHRYSSLRHLNTPEIGDIAVYHGLVFLRIGPEWVWVDLREQIDLPAGFLR